MLFWFLVIGNDNSCINEGVWMQRFTYVSEGSVL